MNEDFPRPTPDTFTIYSKSGCKNCVEAKRLLAAVVPKIIVVDCDEFLIEDREGFLTFMRTIAEKECKTFPMIFCEGKYIGGFADTQEYYKRIYQKQKAFEEIEI